MFRILGMDWRSGGAAALDGFPLYAEEAAAFRRECTARGLAQTVTLSTCNRRELFFCPTGSGLDLVKFFLERFPSAAENPNLFLLSARLAVERLFAVASGLESMILGEYQILGQFKDAYREALASGDVGGELDRVCRDAISCAKRVRTELDMGAVPPSVCRAGMECLDRTVGVAGKRVFIIGSGRTGTLAAELAKEFGARSIAVCNRSEERTGVLVERYGAKAVPYESRYAEASESDIVVSATSSPHVVLRASELRLVRHVAFLDLASPRDVDTALADDPFATLLSIDTIGEMAAGDRSERERLVAAGMAIVREEAAKTLAWLEGRR